MNEQKRLIELRTMPYEEYIQTPEWQEKREKALLIACFRCQLCYSPEYLNVHHRTYERRGDESLSDLTVLCQPCHQHFHERLKMQRPIDEINLSRFKHFQDATFSNFRTNITGVKVAYSKALKFADDPDGWLCFVGPYGCGKTHLVAAIAKKRIEANDTVLIQTAPDLLDYLRAAFSPDSAQSYDERFEAMKKADLLIIDDFGSQADSPWASEKLFQLLNYRYNTGAATVITSNGIDCIDPRIYSRLHDRGLVTLVMMENAGDYRMREL